MSAGKSSVSGSGVNHNDVSYDYGDKKADSGKVTNFNGDPKEFSWWKTNFYNYIIGLDEELWDILEDGVGDLDLMKKELLLTERNRLLLRRKCKRNITRSEVHLFLLYFVQSI